MNSAVCTLFEGDYHYGLGALANSLHAHGYRGVIWAGYRGVLPQWASPISAGPGYSEYQVADAYSIRFVSVNVERHFTNHKPTFMLEVLTCCSAAIESVFYFDPDITINFPWNFFQEWATDAVALCEDVNMVGANHPKRVLWRRYFANLGIDLPEQISAFANGGFVGVPKRMSSLLHNWQEILKVLEDRGIKGFVSPGDYRFWFPDQDALNIALMREKREISIAGRDAMAFEHGTHFMFHAIGGPKPWRKRFVREALNGRPPSDADKGYWSFVESPIRLYPHPIVSMRRTEIRIASAIGRLVRRN